MKLPPGEKINDAFTYFTLFYLLAHQILGLAKHLPE